MKDKTLTVGAKIKCTSFPPAFSRVRRNVTVGNDYEVVKSFIEADYLVRIIDDTGNEENYNKAHFELVTATNNAELNKQGVPKISEDENRENLQESRNIDKTYSIAESVEHLKNGGAIENDNKELIGMLRYVLTKAEIRTSTGTPLGTSNFYYIASSGYWCDEVQTDKPIIKLSQISESMEASTELEAKIHELKTWPEYFEKVLSGEKRFELRVNDRDFKTGDILRLREWKWEDTHGNQKLGNYTGREISKTCGYILSGFGLIGNSVVIQLEDRSETTQQSNDSVKDVSVPQLEELAKIFLDKVFDEKIIIPEKEAEPVYTEKEVVAILAMFAKSHLDSVKADSKYSFISDTPEAKAHAEKTYKMLLGKAEQGDKPTCKVTFKGEAEKSVLYSILTHIDDMKTRGFVFEKHERADLENGNVKIDYVLIKV